MSALLAVLLVIPASAASAATALPLGTPTTAQFNDGTTPVEYSVDLSAQRRLVLDVSQVALNRSSPFGGFGVKAELFEPDGSLFSQFGTIQTTTWYATDPVGAGGTYVLRLTPLSQTTGSFTFSAGARADSVSAITPGTPSTVTYPDDGTATLLTFTGVPGRRFTLSVRDSHLTSPFGAGQVSASIITPGSTDPAYLGDVSSGAWLEQNGLLTSAGTYTVVLTPSHTAGTQQVTIGEVADTTGSITLGTPITIGSDVPGRNQTYTFTGTEGAALEAFVDQSTFAGGTWGGHPDVAGATITVKQPDGTPFLTVFPYQTQGQGVLPATGTYTVTVDPVDDTVGSAVLTLRTPVVTSKALSAGVSTSFQVARGDRARFTFSGTSGRLLALQLRSLAYASGTGSTIGYRLYRPDGSQFAWSGIDAGGYDESARLDATGRWALEFDPGLDAANASFVAWLPVDRVAALTTDQAVTASVTTPGQVVRYRFTAVKGSHPTVDLGRLGLHTSTGAAVLPTLRLLRPDGTPNGILNPQQLPNGTYWGDLSWVSGSTLDAGGTWTLEVDAPGDATGTQSLTLHQVTDVRGTLNLGRSTPITITRRGGSAVETFSWNGAGSLTWKTDLGIPSAQLTLTSPDGQTQGADVENGSTSGVFTGTGKSGRWTLTVDPSGPATGTIRVLLAKA